MRTGSRIRRATGCAGVTCVLVMALAPVVRPALAVAPATSARISQNQDGTPWNGQSGSVAVTPDGRHAVFVTTQNADELDTSPAGQPDAYAVDRRTGRIALVSVANAIALNQPGPGGQSAFDAASASVSLSDDGRYVALSTAATGVNVDQPGIGGAEDVYVCDRDTNNNSVYDEFLTDAAKRETYCTYVGDLSVAPAGEPPQRTFDPRISGNGSTVVWISASQRNAMATRLTREAAGRVLPPTPAAFLTVEPETSSSGPDYRPVLTSSGQYFVSSSDTSDFGEPSSVFGYDAAAGRVDRLDVDSGGTPLNGGMVNRSATTSADGRVVAFEWRASANSPRQVYAVDRDPDADGVFWPGAPGEPFRSTIVSRKTDGTEGNGGDPALSADGRYLAFVTGATGMHDGNDQIDGPGCDPDLSDPFIPSCQVVVRDLVLDAQREVAGSPRLPAALASAQLTGCPSPQGCGAFLNSYAPVLTGDGGEVLFETDDDQVVADDDNGQRDVVSHRFTPAVNVSAPAFPATSGGGVSTALVTVDHVGFGPLPIGALVVAGADAGDFAVEPNSTCAQTTLHQTGQCLVGVRFAPTGEGARNAALVLRDSAGADISTIPLSGTGLAQNQPQPGSPAVLTAGDNDTAFGERPVGTESSPRDITFVNGGGSRLDLRNAALLSTLPGGTAFPGDYSIVADNCASRALEPGEGCSVSVTHTPGGVGQRNVLLRTSSVDGQSRTVLLTGSGAAAGVTVSPLVARPGRVVQVNGQGLPVSSTLTVLLTPVGPPVTVATDSSGRFSLSYLVSRGTPLGNRVLEVRTSDGRPLGRAGVLVARPTVAPPSF